MVFFDIGSTLIEGPPSGPAQRLAERLGLDRAAVAQLRTLLFRTDPGGPEGLGALLAARFAVELGRAREAAAALWRAQLEEAYVLPGAAEAVGRLSAAGIPRGYLSNIWPPFYERFAREFPDEAASPAMFLSFRTGLLKPDPEVFCRALEACGADPGSSVMVGDTYENDIAPALALGLRTVWVLHRPAKEKRDLVRVVNGEAVAPDLTLASIADLYPEQILRLTGRA